jgi:hypothetical protein
MSPIWVAFCTGLFIGVCIGVFIEALAAGGGR